MLGDLDEGLGLALADAGQGQHGQPAPMRERLLGRGQVRAGGEDALDAGAQVADDEGGPVRLLGRGLAVRADEVELLAGLGVEQGVGHAGYAVVGAWLGSMERTARSHSPAAKAGIERVERSRLVRQLRAR